LRCLFNNRNNRPFRFRFDDSFGTRKILNVSVTLKYILLRIPENFVMIEMFFSEKYGFHLTKLCLNVNFVWCLEKIFYLISILRVKNRVKSHAYIHEVKEKLLIHRDCQKIDRQARWVKNGKTKYSCQTSIFFFC